MESFKKTMPLITDLRNPAMRERHWAQLMDHIGARFDPSGESFTLESVINLHLDQHVDFIAELSGNASKELGIETAIQVTGCVSTYAAPCTFKAEAPARHMLACHICTNSTCVLQPTMQVNICAMPAEHCHHLVSSWT